MIYSLHYLVEVKADQAIEHIIVWLLDVSYALRYHTKTPYKYSPHSRFQLRTVIMHDNSNIFVNRILDSIHLTALAISCYVSCEP